MPRRCTVCDHEARDEVDQALSGGIAIGRLSAKHGVSIDALKRHRANHLLPEMRAQLEMDTELRDVDVLAEMRGLYTRMKQHLEQADKTDNWKAIKGLHTEARADLELLAKLMGQLDVRPQVNILVSPEWLQLRATLVGALVGYPEAADAVLTALDAAEEDDAA